MESLLLVKLLKGVKNNALIFGLNTVFCGAIALLLLLLGVTSSIGHTAVTSLCIGWSIHLTFLFTNEALGQILPTYLTPIPQIAIGLLFGLLLAGSIVYGQPLIFYGDISTLMLGVFFGIIGVAISAIYARLLLARAELSEAQTKRHIQDKQLLDTELKLLQAQIEPHFLFNTLSNIVGLIRTQPEAAEQTLLNLTTLLRASLKRTRAQSVTLGEELTIVKAYLDIQKTRMQDRLHFDFSPEQWVNDDLLSQWPLPPLLIQPLVENAIKHGIDPSETGGSVRVSAHCKNDELHIIVADTGVGIDTGKITQKNTLADGTGLSNVRNRLHALYEGRGSMKISDNSPTGLVVEVRIPRVTQ